MTTFLTAEEALIAEVEGRIIALVPEREPAQRFNLRTDDTRELENFDEVQLIPRLFEIGFGVLGEVWSVGRDERSYLYRYPIKFQYPALGHYWKRAALSDAERITHDLLRNTTSLSGLQSRRIDPDSEVVFEQDEEDQYFTMEMQLLVIYEISGT
jgi:hypothetical protein